jgi:uncharacterized protein YbjT (DUF2867 family)
MGMQRRRICILGGTGFVGRQLVRRLFERGHSIVIPTRRRMRHRELLLLPLVELAQGDVHDAEFLQGVLNGADAVINLIGILNEPHFGDDGFRRVHTALASSLVKACAAGGPRRILQMSAINADSAAAPSRYLKTKGEAEDLVRSSGLDYTIFRASVIFGPHDSFINRFADLLRVAPLLPMPRLGALFAPVFVDDVVRAFEVALEDTRTHGRVFELCGPDVVTLRQILEYICATLGLRRAVLELPDALGRIQAAMIEYLVPGKPFTLDNFRSLGAPSVCHDDGLAALGIEATPMSAVVPRMLRGARV